MRISGVAVACSWLRTLNIGTLWPQAMQCHSPRSTMPRTPRPPQRLYLTCTFTTLTPTSPCPLRYLPQLASSKNRLMIAAAIIGASGHRTWSFRELGPHSAGREHQRPIVAAGERVHIVQ